MNLTTLAVARIAPKPTRFDVPDSKIVGLRLTVLPSGQKSWSVRYTIHGRDRRLTLGRFPVLNVDNARKLASAALRTVASGDDPQSKKIEARRRASAGLDRDDLFGAIWDRYIAEYVRPNLKASTAGEIERLALTLILPKFKRRKLSEIGPHDVKALVAAQKTRGAPVQANKVFVTLRAFFNWTRRELLLKESPCAGLQKPESDRHRDRVLSDQEIRWLWRACGEIGFPFGPMTKLLLLTGARRDEVRAMTKGEVDRNGALWTLPGQRVKNGREHAIHLANATALVLDSIPKIENEAGYIFCTNGETPVSGFSRAKRRLDALMTAYAEREEKEIAPWVIHDLRRTVASGMARLGIALPVIERCLNHVSGSFAGIVGVYQKHEFAAEKKAAFDAWARHVETVVTASAAKVVPISQGNRSR